MLRSQSLSNFSDHKKAKGGFLSGLISRKPSQNDLSESKNTTKSSNAHKQRPLSQSFSSMNLKSRTRERKDVCLDASGYVSTQAKQRQSTYENKENMTNISNPSNTNHKSSERSLRTRSSVPNLNYKHKRNSMLFGSGNPKGNNVQIYEDSSDSISVISSESNAKSIYNASVYNGTKQANYEASDFELEFEDSKNLNLEPKKLHRTTNIHNISEFLGLIQVEETTDGNNIIPINNRKSLDFEHEERHKLRLSLQNRLNEEESKSDLNYRINLVQSVLFFTLEGTTSSRLSEYSVICNDDAEYMQSLTQEPYHDDIDVFA